MNSLKHSVKKLGLYVLASVLFYSCATEEVYFNVNEPAPVTIPPAVKRVGILNCSLISDSNHVRKSIDQVLSVKGPMLDKECSNECIRGLKDALIQSNIFPNIVFLDSVNISNSYPGMFPSPISWDVIEDICKKNNVDVLFVLELFHTDTRFNLVPAQGIYGIVAASARMETTVKTGWRIYDPQNMIIRDECPLTDGVSFIGGGVNPLDVTASLMNHKEAVMGLSYRLGQTYAGRILPYTIRVCREFYVNGTENFKISRRMADAGDWKNAADLWNKETENPSPKIRARAFYDMAIISEMNGDVDAAIEWAKKSYETGGKRLALFYLNNLQDRKAQNDLLKSQAH